jgi:ABC-type branched-subunit amino acid transport system ATPase component
MKASGRKNTGPPGDSLRVVGLSKRFGGLRAVHDVSLAVKPGGIHGLIGPNGSGKTTLFNLMSGVLEADAGHVFVDGSDISGASPDRCVKAGLVRTFQHMRLFPEMTAVENVMVAVGNRPDGARPWQLGLRISRRRRAESEARELLNRVGIDSTRKQDERTSKLGFLDRHLTEIARALALGPRYLLLDEPMTGMVAEEAALLRQLIRHVADEGVGVVLVEHHMELVMSLCEHLTVLNFGEVIASGPTAEVSENEKVVTAYLGRRKKNDAGSPRDEGQLRTS